MANKISYCLVSSRWDAETESFVDEYHKDKLYDLSKKDSLKELAVKAVNLLAKGFKLKLITYVDRDAIDIKAQDLFK